MSSMPSWLRAATASKATPSAPTSRSVSLSAGWVCADALPAARTANTERSRAVRASDLDTNDKRVPLFQRKRNEAMFRLRTDGIPQAVRIVSKNTGAYIGSHLECGTLVSQEDRWR